MSTDCPLCGSQTPGMLTHPNAELEKCPECGLVSYAHSGSIDPGEIYSHEYFHGSEYMDYPGSRNALQKTFQSRIRSLLAYHQQGKLLEIGAAYGFFLELAQEHWDVRGIDIAPEAVRYAQEVLSLDVQLGDFLALDEKAGEYEIICMWDTIEHLQNPIAYLEKAARGLAPGGVLALTTGDIDSLASRVQKERWRLIHPPSHLYYFSRQTVVRAFERCGLAVRECSHVGYHRGIKAMLHGLFGRSHSERPWLNRLLALGGSKDIPLYLNLYDILFAVGQKPRKL